eukprot:gene4257-8474_t
MTKRRIIHVEKYEIGSLLEKNLIELVTSIFEEHEETEVVKVFNGDTLNSITFVKCNICDDICSQFPLKSCFCMYNVCESCTKHAICEMESTYLNGKHKCLICKQEDAYIFSGGDIANDMEISTFNKARMSFHRKDGKPRVLSGLFKTLISTVNEALEACPREDGKPRALSGLLKELKAAAHKSPMELAECQIRLHVARLFLFYDGMEKDGRDGPLPFGPLDHIKFNLTTPILSEEAKDINTYTRSPGPPLRLLSVIPLHRNYRIPRKPQQPHDTRGETADVHPHCSEDSSDISFLTSRSVSMPCVGSRRILPVTTPVISVIDTAAAAATITTSIQPPPVPREEERNRVINNGNGNGNSYGKHTDVLLSCADSMAVSVGQKERKVSVDMKMKVEMGMNDPPRSAAALQQMSASFPGLMTPSSSKPKPRPSRLAITLTQNSIDIVNDDINPASLSVVSVSPAAPTPTLTPLPSQTDDTPLPHVGPSWDARAHLPPHSNHRSSSSSILPEGVRNLSIATSISASHRPTSSSSFGVDNHHHHHHSPPPHVPSQPTATSHNHVTKDRTYTVEHPSVASRPTFGPTSTSTFTNSVPRVVSSVRETMPPPAKPATATVAVTAPPLPLPLPPVEVQLPSAVLPITPEEQRLIQELYHQNIRSSKEKKADKKRKWIAAVRNGENRSDYRRQHSFCIDFMPFVLLKGFCDLNSSLLGVIFAAAMETLSP